MPIKAKKRPMVVAVAAAMLTLASAAPAAHAADAPNPPRAALLTVDDLPRGYQSADDWNDIVRAGEPDPDVCVNPVAVGSVVNRPGISAHTSFFRRGDGLLLYEILVDAGPAKARALVADVAAAPRRCPRVRIEDLTLTVAKMSVPDLGVRASGVLIETETRTPIRTRLIVFAEGGVTAIVMAVGVRDAGLRDMHMIALAAEQKLAPGN
jgi:hypothetical protein